MKIQIHQTDPSIQINEQQYKDLCRRVVSEIKLNAASCALVFVNDQTLKRMHAQYLDDPTKTDVITFNLGDESIEGEIYISTDRARVQAKIYSVTPEEEIVRLIVHGLLHLKGYDDREEKDRIILKEEENRLVEMFAPDYKKR